LLLIHDITILHDCVVMLNVAASHMKDRCTV